MSGAGRVARIGGPKRRPAETTQLGVNAHEVSVSSTIAVVVVNQRVLIPHEDAWSPPTNPRHASFGSAVRKALVARQSRPIPTSQVPVVDCPESPALGRASLVGAWTVVDRCGCCRR